MANPLKERRGPIRVRTEQKVWCSYRGLTVGCHSHDLSDSGVRLRAPAPIPVGTVVELRPEANWRLPGRRRLLGRVVWAEDDGWVGLRLESFADSWAAGALRQAMGKRPFQARKSRRLAHCLPVNLSYDARHYLGAAVTQDLSLGGMRLSSRIEVKAGDVLTAYLELPQREEPLALPCKVVSVGEGRVSLRFYRLAPLQERELERFLGGRPANWLTSLWSRLVG